MGKLHCIPNIEELEEYVGLAEKYDLAFEYNEFCLPELLDSKEKTQNMIKRYLSYERDTSKDTLHGVFYDITVHSIDSKIREVSNHRIHQCMDIAERLGVKAVIFHTNNIPKMMDEGYIQNWIDRNALYWTQVMKEHPKLAVYIENMFDDTPDLLIQLSEILRQDKQFGVCFDIAHANISKTDLSIWCDRLNPYIKHIHINDNMGTMDSHLAVGKGTIVWNQYKKLIRGMLVKPSILIEVKGMKQLKESISYMEKESLYPFV